MLTNKKNCALKLVDEIILIVVIVCSQSRWPRGLRRGPMAARLLVLPVQIPPRACMFVVINVLYEFRIYLSPSNYLRFYVIPISCL